jgi:hypothetical protein
MSGEVQLIDAQRVRARLDRTQRQSPPGERSSARRVGAHTINYLQVLSNYSR